jgi:hypothetical protein
MWTWIKRLFGKKSGATPAPASPNSVSASSPSFIVEPPKTTYDERRVNTPNKGSQPIKPEAIVLHHSDGSYRGGVEWIANPVSKVSYHVLIARDGRRTVFATIRSAPGMRARATGRGRSDLNSWSLGVSLGGQHLRIPAGQCRHRQRHRIPSPPPQEVEHQPRHGARPPAGLPRTQDGLGAGAV